MFSIMYSGVLIYLNEGCSLNSMIKTSTIQNTLTHPNALLNTLIEQSYGWMIDLLDN